MTASSRCPSLLAAIEKTAPDTVTEGASFGPLVGSKYRLPRHPHRWTLAELAALRQAHRHGEERQPALGDWWDRVMARREGLFEDYFEVSRLGPLPPAVCREALAETPEIARHTLALVRDFSHPDLALAGHDLQEAWKRLGAVAEPEPLRARAVRRVGFHGVHATMTALEACAPEHGIELPGELQVFRMRGQRRQLAVGGRLGRTALQAGFGGQVLGFTSRRGDERLAELLEAYERFARLALLAQVTLGLTLGLDGVTIDSRPVEGVVVKEVSGGSTGALLTWNDERGALERLRAHTFVGTRVTLPEDDRRREALVDAILHGACCEDGSVDASLLAVVAGALLEHSAAIAPLVDPADPVLSPAEEGELLALATKAYPELAEHVVPLSGGGYRVTRHGITTPIHLLDTEDLVFALRLALGHRERHPLRLGLAVG